MHAIMVAASVREGFMTVTMNIFAFLVIACVMIRKLVIIVWKLV